MSRNTLTAWISEFQRNQPEARPAEAWRHLCLVVLPYGLFSWLIDYDAERDELIYRPSRFTEPRRIQKASFRRQYERTRHSA